MKRASVDDLWFLRLQVSLLCSAVQSEDGKVSISGWLFEIDRRNTAPFYIVHEWCCSLEQSINCAEEIQIVDPDGKVEAHLRMASFPLGLRFWDTVRNYWEVSDFTPARAGNYEILTHLLHAETGEELYEQRDPLRVV